MYNNFFFSKLVSNNLHNFPTRSKNITHVLQTCDIFISQKNRLKTCCTLYVCCNYVIIVNVVLLYFERNRKERNYVIEKKHLKNFPLEQ